MDSNPAEPGADARPLIVLVRSGYRLYRACLLRLVASAARVWFFADAPPGWEHPYIVGHTVVDSSTSTQWSAPRTPFGAIRRSTAFSAGTR
jgi:hypothetical protein